MEFAGCISEQKADQELEILWLVPKAPKYWGVAYYITVPKQKQLVEKMDVQVEELDLDVICNLDGKVATSWNYYEGFEKLFEEND